MNSPKVDSYRFGQIVIDGQTYTSDLIILPDRLVENWWRIAGHSLHVNDLRAVFEAAPEALVIGQGASGRMMVPNETRRALEDAGINVVILPTSEACQQYNKLRKECQAAAALHLTC